jgi:hypothetical protein
MKNFTMLPESPTAKGQRRLRGTVNEIRSTDKRLAAQLCKAGHRAPNIGLVLA